MFVNFLYQAVYQILVLILPIITTPYVSRVLGVEGIGLYSYSYAVVSYFVSFANMGINVFGNREIAAVQHDKEKRSQLFWDLLSIQLSLSSLCFLIYCLIIGMGNWKNKTVFFIQSIYIIGQALDINWFYFGLEKFKITVIRNLFVKILTTALIFLTVKSQKDLSIYLLILSIGTVVGNSAVWMFVSQYIVLKKPCLVNVKKYVKPIIILMLPSFAVKMYTQMDKIFIEFFCGLDQVGYYENAEKVIQVSFVLITALSTVTLPRMAALDANHEEKKYLNLWNRIFDITLWLTSALMFGMLSIADNLIKFYLGMEYLPCIEIVMILAWTIPFKGGAEIVRRGYIIPKKYDSIYISSLFIGAAVNVVINTWLIPFYGTAGASIGTVVAEMTVFFLQVYKIRKNVTIFRQWKKLVYYLAMGVFMMLCNKWIASYISELPIGIALMLQLTVGVTVYMILTGIYIIFKYRKNKEELIKCCRMRG